MQVSATHYNSAYNPLVSARPVGETRPQPSNEQQQVNNTPPAPTVNTQGQTIGSLINIRA